MIRHEGREYGTAAVVAAQQLADYHRTVMDQN